MKTLRAIGRAILLCAVRVFFAKLPSPPPPIDLHGVRRVLIIRIDTRVGNVLLTTPLVRALRKGLPRARVDLLVAAGKAHLVDGLADRVLTFRKKDFFRRPWRFLFFLSALRGQHYDVVIDASHWHAFSFTSLWLARWTRAPVRIGHARELADRFVTHTVRCDPTHLREVQFKLELLRPFAVPEDGEYLETSVDRSPSVQAAAEEILSLAGSPLVAILNPGSRKRTHRWPARAFGMVARTLRDRFGAVSLVVWGPGEEALADQVVAASGGAARLSPPTDLALLAALFRRSAVVITNDTGPMHLAVAARVPVVATLMAPDGGRWSHPNGFTGVPVKEGSDEEVERVVAEVARVLLQRSTG